ncbi:MAG: response regulator [Actinomycetota bacterium]
MQPRVLIVEDEVTIADAIRYALDRHGFRCEVVHDGRSALASARASSPDLVLLDLMLPGLDGNDVCRELRKTSTAAVMVISARDSEADKVLALELGADDYLTKPFGTAELIARARALLRRQNPVGDRTIETTLEAGPIAMDVDRHEASVRGEPLDLPLKEFVLLEVLVRRAGRLCLREHLISDVWGPDYFGDTRTLDVHIKRLREKIEEDKREPRHLLTVRGLGYKFQP